MNKGTTSTERSYKIQRQIRNKKKKKKLQQSGQISLSISMWTQELTIKRTLPNMERQTDSGAGREGGKERGREGVSCIVQCVNSTSRCPVQSRELERSRQGYLSRCGSARRDKLRWTLPPLLLSSDRTRETALTPTPERAQRKLRALVL